MLPTRNFTSSFFPLCHCGSRSLVLYLCVRVCSSTGLRWLCCVFVFLSVPTGMVKHFQAHSFMDLLSMLYIFLFFFILISRFSALPHFGVFHICLVHDAREAIRRVNIRCSCSHSQFIFAGWMAAPQPLFISTLTARTKPKYKINFMLFTEYLVFFPCCTHTHTHKYIHVQKVCGIHSGCGSKRKSKQAGKQRIVHNGRCQTKRN